MTTTGNPVFIARARGALTLLASGDKRDMGTPVIASADCLHVRSHWTRFFCAYDIRACSPPRAEFGGFEVGVTMRLAKTQA